ncbi:hypothetical protein PFMC_04643 [Plasmodium falciparum CAMP/Malaysia]|uniref:Uncharacterized protein n=1 Tax=Plasmodium falciparum (isolate Camp / Malaysia) TaxID=5835 RepID=A0A024X313_PLAFC|nr:hypothetical protein PFMC_04643 [Plasmodium falciparum CAMP/Malaysia]
MNRTYREGLFKSYALSFFKRKRNFFFFVTHNNITLSLFFNIYKKYIQLVNYIFLLYFFYIYKEE